eukprot:gene12925-biopygen5430
MGRSPRCAEYGAVCSAGSLQRAPHAVRSWLEKYGMCPCLPMQSLLHGDFGVRHPWQALQHETGGGEHAPLGVRTRDCGQESVA